MFTFGLAYVELYDKQCFIILCIVGNVCILCASCRFDLSSTNLQINIQMELLSEE